MVFTLSEYVACNVWQEASADQPALCATLRKCFGRKMVLDMTLCSDEAGDEFESWFTTTFLDRGGNATLLYHENLPLNSDRGCGDSDVGLGVPGNLYW